MEMDTRRQMPGLRQKMAPSPTAPAVMDDLIAFLMARLDEDEANARDALALWPDTHFTVNPGSLVIVRFHRVHDPARVLREVEAKRRLLRQFELRGNSVRATVQPRTGGVWDDLLRMLALPYADHPDCRPEWTP